jgi:GTP pyrophosphokinase
MSGRICELGNLLDNQQTKIIENRQSFLDRFSRLPQEDINSIELAYDLAKESHRPQKRDSGERYFEHLRSAAIILVDECQILDPNLIIAELLHDTGEDSPIFGNIVKDYDKWKETTNYRLSKIFNHQVAQYVITLTKPKIDDKKITSKEESEQIYLNGLKQAKTENIILKMCDRLHNLRSLSGTSPEKQIKTCHETVDKYFPIFSLIQKDYPNQYHHLTEQMTLEIQKFI